MIKMGVPIRIRVRFQKKKEVKREFSGEGKILVKKGQKVRKDQVLAEFFTEGEVLVFNLCSLLGAKRPVGKKVLLVKIGEEVEKGRKLAQVGSFFFGKKTLIAPCFGKVLDLKKSGELLFQKKLGAKKKILSLFPGVVEKVGKKGVVLKTSFLEILGVEGKGKGEGKILLVKNKKDLFALFERETLEENIVVFFQTPSRAVLPKLKIKRVGGVVFPGIHFRDFETLADFPLILTEGFGQLSLGRDLQEVFQRLEKERALLKGKRLLVPQEKGEEKQEEKERELKVGDWVRIVGEPGPIGLQGKVLAIGKKEQLPSYFTATVVQVKTEKGVMKVPKENVEIIEI